LTRDVFALLGLSDDEHVIYWTGSYSDGSLYTDGHCNAWTSASSSYSGENGNSNWGGTDAVIWRQ